MARVADIWKQVQAILGVDADGKPGIKTATAVLARLTRDEKPAAQPAVAGRFADRLVRIAEAEVGVREVPPDSNRGPRVEQFQQSTWLAGSGWPWCAAFVCWAVREAMASEKFEWVRPQTAGAWDFERWAREQPGGLKLLRGSTPAKKGDILVYTFSHIGIAAADMTGGLVATIEGNTNAEGSREGGGVYRQTRSKEQIRSIIRFE